MAAIRRLSYAQEQALRRCQQYPGSNLAWPTAEALEKRGLVTIKYMPVTGWASCTLTDAGREAIQ